MRTRFIFLTICTMLLPLFGISQQDSSFRFGEDNFETDYFFGFNLVPNSIGNLYHVALIKLENNGTYKIKQITKETFIAQAKGLETSEANPQGIDLFEKFQIKNPNIIDDLWKLRYKKYPWSEENMEGYSSRVDSLIFLPSPGQLKTLENFGMFRMSDYIYGDNAFRLLQLMSKPEWVKLYKETY